MSDTHPAAQAAPARPGWVVATLLAGACLAVQARMNGELAVVWGQSLDAAMWSFGSGLLVLTGIAAVSPSVRRGFRSMRESLRYKRLRPWQCVGGLIGGVYVFCQAYAVPLAGVALFTIAVVGGQTASAVVVDRLGIGPAGRVPVTWARVVAAGLAAVGVVVAVGGRVTGTSPAILVPVLLAALVGAAMTVQQGLNGRVTVAAGNSLSTTWLNFALGTAVLLALAVPTVSWGVSGVPVTVGAPPWAWFGGVLGIVVVSVSAAGVRHLGVLLVMLLVLAGQLLASVGLDALDAKTRGQITPVVLLGLAVTLAAAATAGVAANRSDRRARQPAVATAARIPSPGRAAGDDESRTA